MDKIVCDVCGTSYPEISGQCPICGYVKPSRAKSAATEEAGYTYVKGGRFSSTNVKRRNQNKGLPTARANEKGPERKKNSSTAMGITAIAMLLVLIAVLIFFIVKVANRNSAGADGQNAAQTEQSTSDSGGQVLCQELHTDTPVVELAEAGAKWVIHTTSVPADTTDSITYTSADPEIASVDDSGTVTAVAGGETAVTVRCGNAMLIVTVKCAFGDQGGQWSMNREDMTLFKKGETWDLYSKTSTVAKNNITWTSDDETVAKIDGGIVEAVGSGVTEVHGEYNGIKYSCTIRCKLSDEDSGSTEPTQSGDDQSNVDTASLKISHEDVTISVKESFTLRLRDASGKTLDVEWKASRDGYITIDGNTVTGVKSTKNDFVTVSATVGDETFKCIVRVK